MPGDLTSGADIDAEVQTRRVAPSAKETPAETEAFKIRVRRTGYIQHVDPQVMLTLARERDLVIQFLRKPGHYVGSGAVVALVWPAGQVDERTAKMIRRAFLIGNGRTPTQDVVYAVNQLTEMAVRAMSPAINDPFTAMTCLDHLGEGLISFVRQGENDSHYYDRDGTLRLVLEPVTFAELLDAAFEMLRHASCDNAMVLRRMLGVIGDISRETKSPETIQQLLRHVCLIEAESRAGDLIEADRQAIHEISEALLMRSKGAAGAEPQSVAAWAGQG
jgi:uncharacterized membrane protein